MNNGVGLMFMARRGEERSVDKALGSGGPALLGTRERQLRRDEARANGRGTAPPAARGFPQRLFFPCPLLFPVTFFGSFPLPSLDSESPVHPILPIMTVGEPSAHAVNACGSRRGFISFSD